jgi:hypothetical protein
MSVQPVNRPSGTRPLPDHPSGRGRHRSPCLLEVRREGDRPLLGAAARIAARRAAARVGRCRPPRGRWTACGSGSLLAADLRGDAGQLV